MVACLTCLSMHSKLNGFIRLRQCRSLELAIHSISTCTEVRLYCTLGLVEMLALLDIRIPSPLDQWLCNENAANCVSSNLKLG